MVRPVWRRVSPSLLGRRRLALCAVASACTLAFGVSGVAAHSGGRGDHGGGDHGRAAQQVTTRVDAIDHGRKDDRGAGDDRTRSAGGERAGAGDERGSAGGEAGGPRLSTRTTATFPVTTTITPTGRSPRVGEPATSPLPLPVPLPPAGPPPEGASTNPGGAATTTPAPVPARSVPAPRPPARPGSSRPAAGVFVPAPPSGPAPTPAVPRISLPPLVLIPPIGLPSPPSLNSVGGSGGVAPLVVVLAAMVALSVILGVRLARRSR